MRRKDVKVDVSGLYAFRDVLRDLPLPQPSSTPPPQRPLTPPPVSTDRHHLRDRHHDDFLSDDGLMHPVSVSDSPVDNVDPSLSERPSLAIPPPCLPPPSASSPPPSTLSSLSVLLGFSDPPEPNPSSTHLSSSCDFYKPTSQILDPLHSLLSALPHLECLFCFGQLVSLEIFLEVVVVAPIRFIIVFCRWFLSLFVSFKNRKKKGSGLLTSFTLFDVLRTISLFMTTLLLSFLDYSRVYHFIREQSFLKLYVMFNMVEILERLSGSLGEDLEDLVFFTVRKKEKREEKEKEIKSKESLFLIICKFLLSLFGFWFVLVIHSIMQLIKLIVLNVSINSSAMSHASLLIAINFTELKKCVFRKWTPPRLFQVLCSDISQRFSLGLWCCLIVLNNASVGAGGWGLLAALLFAEFLVDAIKHCFIAKHNRMDLAVYSSFGAQIARDELSVGTLQHDVLDRCGLIARRLGMLPLPLAAVFLRELWKFISYVRRSASAGRSAKGWMEWLVRMGLFRREGETWILGIVLLWLVLILVYVVVCSLTRWFARWYVKREQKERALKAGKEDSEMGEDELACELRNVFRFHLYEKRIP